MVLEHIYTWYWPIIYIKKKYVSYLNYDTHLNLVSKVKSFSRPINKHNNKAKVRHCYIYCVIPTRYIFERRRIFCRCTPDSRNLREKGSIVQPIKDNVLVPDTRTIGVHYGVERVKKLERNKWCWQKHDKWEDHRSLTGYPAPISANGDGRDEEKQWRGNVSSHKREQGNEVTICREKSPNNNNWTCPRAHNIGRYPRLIQLTRQ